MAAFRRPTTVLSIMSKLSHDLIRCINCERSRCTS